MKLNAKKIIDIISTEQLERAEDAVRKIFYKWLIGFVPELQRLEEYKDGPIFDDFDDGIIRFSENHLFLFFVGYIMSIEPWSVVRNYTDNMDFYDNLGHELMKKAHSIQSYKLYEWGMEENESNRLKLVPLVKQEIFPIEDPLISFYFENELT